MHIFITFVGKVKGPAWNCFDHVRQKVLPVDKAYLFFSDFSAQNAHELAIQIYKAYEPDGDESKFISYDMKTSNEYGSRVCTRYIPHKDSFDFSIVRSRLTDVYTEPENENAVVSMNATNGNTITKTAMIISAADVGASLYYVNELEKGNSSKFSVEFVTKCDEMGDLDLGRPEKRILYALKQIDQMKKENSIKHTLTSHGHSEDTSIDSADVASEVKDSVDSVPENSNSLSIPEEITQGFISKFTEIAKWNQPLTAQLVSSYIDKLVRKGLVRISETVTEKGEKDRKKKIVTMTNHGRIQASLIKSEP